MSRTLQIGRAGLITMNTLAGPEMGTLALEEQEDDEELSGEKDIPGT